MNEAKTIRFKFNIYPSGLEDIKSNNGEERLINTKGEKPCRGPKKYKNLEKGDVVKLKNHVCARKRIQLKGIIINIEREDDGTPTTMTIKVSMARDRQLLDKEITLAYKQIKKKKNHSWIITRIANDLIKQSQADFLDLSV